MGIFSDSTEIITEAYVSSVSLINPNDYTDTRLEYLISAARFPNEDIAENIVASNLTGFPSYVRRYSVYGRKYYVYPPPKGIFKAEFDRYELAKVIRDNVTADPEAYILKVNLGSLDPDFAFRKWLIDSNWKDERGRSWKETDLTYQVKSRGSSVVRTVRNEPFGVFTEDMKYINCYFPYSFAGVDHNTVIVTTLRTPIRGGRTGHQQTNQCYMVEIGFRNDPDKRLYWYYDPSTRKYPKLSTSQSSKKYYLPVAILMQDKKWFDKLGSKQASTTRRLLRKIHLKADDIKKEIENAEISESNKIEKYDVFVHFALDIGEYGWTNKFDRKEFKRQQPGNEYIFQYFHSANYVRNWGMNTFFSKASRHVDKLINLYSSKDPDSPKYDRNPTSSGTTTHGPDTRGLTSTYTGSGKLTATEAGLIASGVVPTEANIRSASTSFNNGSGTHTVGGISDRGDTGIPDLEAFSFEDLPYQIISLITGGRYGFVHVVKFYAVEHFYTTNPDSDPPGLLQYINLISSYPRQYQAWFPYYPRGRKFTRDLGSGKYEVIILYGLSGEYTINTSQGERFAEGNVIPIHEEPLERLNSRTQETVLQASARATMFLVHEEKHRVKWYQKGLFKVLFVALTIVVVFLTKQYYLMSWAAAIAGGSALFLKVLLIKLAVSFLVAFTSQFVLGDELGMIFALAVGFYLGGGINMTNVGDNLWSTLKNKVMGDPVTLLKNVSDVYMKRKQIMVSNELKQLQYDMESWLKDYREREEELEDLYYQLKPNWILSPLDITTKGNEMFYLEEPDRFYERTAANKNPGVKSLDLISRFYQICLKLPEDPGEANPLMALNKLPMPGEI